MSSRWTCVLELGLDRRILNGSPRDLAAAVGRGADLRIGTEFRHNEHIDVTSNSAEQILEFAEFGVTYLIEGHWTAGIMSLRQPISLPDGFGPRPSMSFFLYNQDGTQAIARPFLDGLSASNLLSSAPPDAPAGMPRYHAFDNWDHDTNAPSHNFVYDFDCYRFCVNDSWQEVVSIAEDGTVVNGSLQFLVEAFKSGAALKVGVSGLCREVFSRSNVESGQDAHELFVQAGSVYYYTDRRLLIAGTHPLVRVSPAIPMKYRSGNWDFGWLMVRTDGQVVYRQCDPYGLKFKDLSIRCAVRWFVR